MSEYYAVIRSTNHLAHYGIKGMKWGVRKAIERGSDRKLSRQFNKASKKLEKLTQKADINLQKQLSKKHNKRAAIAAGIGGVSVLGIVGARSMQNSLMNKPNISNSTENLIPTSVRKKKVVGEGKGIHKVGNGLSAELVGAEHVSAPSVYMPPHPAFSPGSNVYNTTTSVNLSKAPKKGPRFGILHGVAAASFATAAYQKGKAIAAKHRTTSKGHAKAVAKRDAWAKEMKSAFKGTQYDASTGSIKKRRKSR